MARYTTESIDSKQTAVNKATVSLPIVDWVGGVGGVGGVISSQKNKRGSLDGHETIVFVLPVFGTQVSDAMMVNDKTTFLGTILSTCSLGIFKIK